MKTYSLAIWQSALIGWVVAVCVNLMVLQFVKPLAPNFKSLSTFPVIFWTTVAVLGATTAFALVRKYAKEPRKTFAQISVGALLLSFGMDIPLFFFTIPGFTGVTHEGLYSLMAMHVIVAAISVPTLIKLTK